MRKPVLAGPTASGKTEIAIELAERHGMEIVSIDSRQLYQGMSIGSAAPTREQRDRVPHHLVDCIDPATVMTAGDFGRLAREAVQEIEGRGKQALLSGGSGLYLRAALGGLDEDLPNNPEVRRQLLREAERLGPEYLHQRLAALDPPTAERTNPRDEVRVVRALEVCEITGKPISILRQSGGVPSCEARVLVLTYEVDTLVARIQKRVTAMIESGLVEEVQALLKRGLPPEQPALKSVGYAETIQYLEGTLDRDAWVEAIVVSTRRYAKRQRTWFRSTPGAIPVPISAKTPLRDIVARAEAILELD